MNRVIYFQVDQTERECALTKHNKEEEEGKEAKRSAVFSNTHLEKFDDVNCKIKTINVTIMILKWKSRIIA